MTTNTGWTRICAGHYRKGDLRIDRTPSGWVMRNTLDRFDYSDPYPTMRELIEVSW
jgi:hypothetical protein